MELLKNLVVRNYKNIQNLKLDGLGNVNLFTGKNNTGKSSLLEAISIYINNGDLSTLVEILKMRGELNADSKHSKIEDSEELFSAFSSLFSNWKPINGKTKVISIGETTNTLFGEEIESDSGLHIDIVRYIEEKERSDDNTVVRTNIILLEDHENSDLLANVGFTLRMRKKNNQNLIPFSSFYRFPRYSTYNNFFSASQDRNFQYVKPTNTNDEENSSFWDKIALTEKEEYVIEGLKIIEPSIQRVAFVGEKGGDRKRNERKVVAKLNGMDGTVPLQSMGDGINRILSIILSLVNAENGVFVIDEFENGLHHSVQRQLWEIIFKLSKSLNIQVFATTHSSDCIDSFEGVLNSQSELSGKLFRLERKKDGIKVVEFNQKELQVATDNDIETR